MGKKSLWLLLKPPRTPRPYSAIIVISVYYPPGQTTEDERVMYEYVTNGLDNILQDHPSAGVIIAGDFNKMRLNPLCRRFNLKKPYGLLQEVEIF
jgi:exonuclease III